MYIAIKPDEQNKIVATSKRVPDVVLRKTSTSISLPASLRKH